MTFKGARKIDTNHEFITDYRILTLPDGCYRFLQGLMTRADRVGNVDLDLEEFNRETPLTAAGISLEDMYEWVKELTERRLLAPYVVSGHRYASLVGWNDISSPMFQRFQPICKSDKQRRRSRMCSGDPNNCQEHWLNPSPDEADEETPTPKKRVKKVNDGQDLPRVQRVERQTSVREGEDEDRGEEDLPQRRRASGAQGGTESDRKHRSKPRAHSGLLTRSKRVKGTQKPAERVNGHDPYPTEDTEDYEPQNRSEDPLFDAKARLAKLRRMEPVNTYSTSSAGRLTEEDRRSLRLFGKTADQYRQSHNH